MEKFSSCADCMVARLRACEIHNIALFKLFKKNFAVTQHCEQVHSKPG